MSILILEDDDAHRNDLCQFLTRDGRTVRAAASVAEARRLASEASPAVMCLDLQLPDGDGMDLLSELRGGGCRAPAIVMTGAQPQNGRIRAGALGVSGVLAKPFQFGDLQRLIDTALREIGAPVQTDEAPGAQPAIDRHSLAPGRIVRVKSAYATRHADLGRAALLLSGAVTPRAGDLVLARIAALGQHGRIELASGRRAQIYVGDEVILCYANRYAPDQFEAEVPGDLGPCQMVAAGGIAAASRSRNSKVKRATQIVPIGLLADQDGRALNLRDFGLARRAAPVNRVPVIAVLGTAMNAGKTTAVADMVHGLSRAGLKVGAAKVTGTGAGGDKWSMSDAGAERVLDFSDFGAPSTYKLPPEEVEGIMTSAVAHLNDAGMDVIVMEIADGILQGETRALVLSQTFHTLVDHILFAAGDALGALAGAQWLTSCGLPPVGLSGLLTSSALMINETAQATGLPVFSRDALQSATWLQQAAIRFDAAAENMTRAA